MAPSNQQTNYQSGPGFPGRKGHKNNGRSNGNSKKGRGGRGNGNDSHGDNSSGWGPHENHNYGSQTVPDVPSAGGYLAGPTPPAWQMARGGYPTPVGGMDTGLGPLPPVALPMSNPAVWMGFAPRSPPIGSSVPQRMPSHGCTPVASHLPQVALSNDRTGPTNATCNAEVTPADPIANRAPAEQSKVEMPAIATSASSTSDAGSNMRADAPSFLPLHMPVPRHKYEIPSDKVITELNPVTPSPTNRLRQSASATPPPLLAAKELSPKGNSMHIAHPFRKDPGETVELLSHKTLTHLQALDISDAIELRSTLHSALKDRCIRQDAANERRKDITAKILEAYEQEQRYEESVASLYDSFIGKMTQSLGGANHEPLQRKAVGLLNLAKQASALALNQRIKVERYRDMLHDVDRKVTHSSNDFANAVYDVVVQALARPEKTAQPQDSDEDATKVIEDILETASLQDDQSKIKTHML